MAAFWQIRRDQLVFKRMVGKGNFGEVYEGDFLGTRVAIKKLYFTDEEDLQPLIESEMDILIR